jgi:hypothetical protein
MEAGNLRPHLSIGRSYQNFRREEEDRNEAQSLGRRTSKTATLEGIRDIALWSRGMARRCHLQNPAQELFSGLSSSGGGLPGRPDLEREAGRSLF